MAASTFVHVERTKDHYGRDKIILKEKCGFSAEVYLYGAQVTSWKNQRGEELLFTSSPVPLHFDMQELFHPPPKPVRGGIQVCFPLFDNEKHGTVQEEMWEEDPDPEDRSSHAASVDLILKHCDIQKDTEIFPHRYIFRLRVTLNPNGALDLTSRIENAESEKFECSFSYHVYMHVGIGDVLVEGLEFCDYIDNLAAPGNVEIQNGTVVFEEDEIDRMYLNTVEPIFVVDFEKKRQFVVKKDMTDASIWYPGGKKARELAALDENEDYHRMFILKPAAFLKPGHDPQMFDGGVVIGPGGTWKGSMTLIVYDTLNPIPEKNQPSRSPEPIDPVDKDKGTMEGGDNGGNRIFKKDVTFKPRRDYSSGFTFKPRRDYSRTTESDAGFSAPMQRGLISDPKIDPSVTIMTVGEKSDVTYNDVGGCKEQIEKMREVSGE